MQSSIFERKYADKVTFRGSLLLQGFILERGFAGKGVLLWSFGMLVHFFSSFERHITSKLEPGQIFKQIC